MKWTCKSLKPSIKFETKHEIYQPDAKFFDNAADDSGDEEVEDSDDDDDGSDDKDAAEVKTKQTKSKKDKPYTLTLWLLDQGATAADSDDEDEDEDESEGKDVEARKVAGVRRGAARAAEAFLKQTEATRRTTRMTTGRRQPARGDLAGAACDGREDYAAWLRHQLEQEEHTSTRAGSDRA